MCAQENAPKVPFWDNDSLAALLAIELKADLLLLMTDVNGLYTGPPSEPSSQCVPPVPAPSGQRHAVILCMQTAFHTQRGMSCSHCWL